MPKFLRSLIAPFILLSTSLMAGCNQTAVADKYSAEENGYLSEANAIFAALCSVGTTREEQESVIPVQTQCGMDGMGIPRMCTNYIPTYKTVTITSMADSGVDPSEALRLADATLPPESLVKVHGLLVEALQGEQSSPLPSDRLLRIQQACGAKNDFEAAVQARTDIPEKTDSMYLSFKPIKYGPSIEYDTRTGLGFSIDESLTVPTGYGDLTIGHREARGIHRLVVRFNGKQRIFTLDRPFEFDIPSGYSTKVQYEGGDDLTITVVGSG